MSHRLRHVCLWVQSERAVSTQSTGGSTKHWISEWMWPFCQACLPGEGLPGAWSLAQSHKHPLPWTLYLLSAVCASHSIYDTPAGTAIRMNAAWGAWGAQFPRAGGKSVTVRNKNDQILSKLWQLLTTSHLLICSNAKLFFFSSS